MRSGVPALVAENIHKRFGEREVLKGISFSAQRGDVVTLIGSSGSGKSTLLRCLNLLEQPHEGELSLGGEALKLVRDRDGSLKAADALHADLADRYVESARLADLEAALAAADWSGGDAHGVVAATLEIFASDPGVPTLAERRAAIERCFARDSVEAILAALEAEGEDWAERTLETLGACSPTSLKVTFEQLRRGATLGFDEAMIMEFRLSQAFLARHDFHEGIRAAVIDKDNAPKWQPDTLAEVTPALVEAHFAPLGEGDLRFD